MPDSAQRHSFLDDAVDWHRTGAEAPLLRLIRSPYSGILHDVGAAYATLAARTGALLDQIDRGALALPSDERENALRFSARARRVASLPAEMDDGALREAIAGAFELSTNGRETRYEPDEPPSELELAEPVAREPEFGVAAWDRHFSASALNTYAECARKWFYRYACAAVEDPGSAASAYGTALHLALEDFHGDFPRPESSARGAMRARMRECVTWAFERNRDGFVTAVEFELHVRRAQRTALRYLDWFLAQEKDAPFEVLGREVAASLELDGRPFVGYIDRLDRDARSGGIGVVDYKTGSIAMSAAEYCEKVRRFRDFQLPFYYWARTAAGDRVVRLVLIPLKDALIDVRPIVLEVSARAAPAVSKDDACGRIAISELEQSRGRMIELSNELASGEIRRFAPTEDAGACTYCAYAIACAFKPFPEARRFGS
ncbi:MAG: PD-(D/E)XK nuclease family protein [Candidatus Eremiobacteraeota bacterium]|nr:PD-(D/E)XK nuclease family protein [Candidatus Eremiobacteraeota bacterium]